MIRSLAAGPFDLLVIGGGITGAGVAREAALRGLRVALVERVDFAYGTSSRSTKLIHGGLRYLKNFDFKLVRESVQERMRLIAMAPHIVKIREFVFPVYQGDPDALWMLRAGLTLYDWFAGSGNPVPHKILGPSALLAKEPGLSAERLVGGAYYLDCATDDGRLTLEVIQSAVEHGAVVSNYAGVESFIYEGGKVAGARVRDEISGAQLEVRAARVLAAGGPWADAVRRLDDPSAQLVLRCTKGVHLTLTQAALPLRHPVVLRGKDGRMMFAVPAGGFSYVGTTDTDYEGDPAAVGIDRADVSYIREAVVRTFPGARVTPDDVVGAWAGLRPLIRPAQHQSPSAVSRDYQIVHSPSGLVSVAGGKLTAFRAMASHIVAELFPRAGVGREALAKSMAPLPGAADPDVRAPEALVARLAAQTGMPTPFVAEIAERFGAAFASVMVELGEEVPSDGRLAWLRAQLRHAVKHEMAVRLEDVLARRTSTLLFSVGNGREFIETLAVEMGGLLDWSPERVAAEQQRTEALIAAMFAWKQ